VRVVDRLEALEVGDDDRELRFVAAKSDVRLRIEERRKWKQITMAARQRVRP